MDLLPHNKTAYDAVVEHLKHSNRTCVVHPTGTGKSYCSPNKNVNLTRHTE